MATKRQPQQLPLTRSRRRTKRTYRSPARQKKIGFFHMPWAHWTPKRRAVVGRTLKIAAYYIIGYVLAILAFAIVYILTDRAVDPLVVQITGFIVASITGGVHKAINWQAAGIDPSTLPAPNPDASLPTTVTLPTITKEG